CGQFLIASPRRRSSKSPFLICPRWCICQVKKVEAQETTKKNIPIRPQAEGFAIEIEFFINPDVRLRTRRIEHSHSVKTGVSCPCAVPTARIAKQRSSELNVSAARRTVTGGAGFVGRVSGRRRSQYVGKACIGNGLAQARTGRAGELIGSPPCAENAK